MAMPKVAIIQFPGSNCEYETQRAAAFYGFQAEIIRWNTPQPDLRAYDAFILPGGFSYQDRVRSGAIAAKLPIMQSVSDAASDGKLVLGICNGCQVLAESGLVTEMAMAPNARDNKPVGFICNWQYVQIQNPTTSPFTQYFSEDDVIPIPVNHGEGRFVLSDTALSGLSKASVLRYVSAFGGRANSFPINPNGSTDGIAGLSSATGTVFAMMPHPERAAFLKQVPTSLVGDWGNKRMAQSINSNDTNGPWEKLFIGMLDYTKARG